MIILWSFQLRVTRVWRVDNLGVAAVEVRALRLAAVEARAVGAAITSARLEPLTSIPKSLCAKDNESRDGKAKYTA